MEKKSYKALKIVSTFTLIFIILWIVLYGFQTYVVLGVEPINLQEPHKGLKIGWFIANRVLILITAALLIAFVKNILKSIKDGAIFNRCNVKILFALVVVLPIHSFISDSVSSVCSDKCECVLTDSPFVYTTVTLLIAILYKLAYDAAEEQKLTV